MRAWGVLLGVAGLGLLVGAIAMGFEGRLEGGPLGMLGQLFADAAPTAKIAMLAALLGLVVALVIGVGRLNGGRGPDDSLDGIGFSVAALGGLAGAYNGWIVHQVAEATHTTNLMVMAPSIGEALLAAGLGLLVGGLAITFNTILRARA